MVPILAPYPPRWARVDASGTQHQALAAAPVNALDRTELGRLGSRANQ
jgi:hypothetical protein